VSFDVAVPTGVLEYLLRFLGNTDLRQVGFVSRRWYVIAKVILQERKLQGKDKTQFVLCLRFHISVIEYEAAHPVASVLAYCCAPCLLPRGRSILVPSQTFYFYDKSKGRWMSSDVPFDQQTLDQSFVLPPPPLPPPVLCSGLIPTILKSRNYNSQNSNTVRLGKRVYFDVINN
jgi:hypothetical protein